MFLYFPRVISKLLLFPIGLQWKYIYLLYCPINNSHCYWLALMFWALVFTCLCNICIKLCISLTLIPLNFHTTPVPFFRGVALWWGSDLMSDCDPIFTLSLDIFFIFLVGKKYLCLLQTLLIKSSIYMFWWIP